MEHQLALTAQLESWLLADPRFELVTPRSFSLVCFRLRSSPTAPSTDPIERATSERLTKALLDRLNASGLAYLTHTVLNGEYVIRWTIGSMLAEEKYVRDTFRAMKAMAAQVLSEHQAQVQKEKAKATH